MQQKLMKKTTVLVCLFSVIALGLIIGLSTTKVVTITEVAQDEVVRTGDAIEPQTSSADSENVLVFDAEEATDYLCIPLPEGSKAEEITIENHYMDQELYVLIQNAQESFYAEHALRGNRAGVEAGVYHETEDGVALIFNLIGGILAQVSCRINPRFLIQGINLQSRIVCHDKIPRRKSCNSLSFNGRILHKGRSVLNNIREDSCFLHGQDLHFFSIHLKSLHNLTDLSHFILISCCKNNTGHSAYLALFSVLRLNKSHTN